MGLIQEFKEFAVKGNAVDLAVGVIIGAAFGKVVGSVVNDLIMPPIGRVTGGLNYEDLFINLTPAKGSYETLAAAKEAGAATLNYGLFISVAIDFMIVAFCVFLLVKAINILRRQQAAASAPAAAPPAPTREEVLLTEIRDALRERR